VIVPGVSGVHGKRRWRAVSRAALVAAAVAWAVLGLAIGDVRSHVPGPPDEHLERDLQALGLAPEQRARVEAMLEAARGERQAIRARIEAAYDAMHVLLEPDHPDEAAVMRQAETIGAIKTDRRKAMLRMLLRVRAELTPEQRLRLQQLMREARRRRNAGDAATATPR
jgi:Spy/CpxP family protein refolding chaperone